MTLLNVKQAAARLDMDPFDFIDYVAKAGIEHSLDGTTPMYSLDDLIDIEAQEAKSTSKDSNGAKTKPVIPVPDVPPKEPTKPEETAKQTPQEFILQFIEENGKGDYMGVHTRFGNLNSRFAEEFPDLDSAVGA